MKNKLPKLSIYQIVLIAIIAVGAILRFYNLDWGEGNFFHPDERNIGIAVANIDPSNRDYNPNFFAYGSFPIYMIYYFSKGNFELSILSGRFLSAFFSTISLLLIYSISKQLLVSILARGRGTITQTRNIEKFALLTTAVAATSPALIQFAHFTTFESFLTFEYLLFAYFGIKLIHRPNFVNYSILGAIVGLAVGTKIVSLFLLGIFCLIHLIVVFSDRVEGYDRLRFLTRLPYKILSINFLFSLILSIVVFLMTNPFMYLDFESFRGSLDYESSVARGTMIVFYTQQFLETIPAVYQFLYVFPSLASWPITIVGSLSIIYLILLSVYFSFTYFFKKTGKVKLPILVFLLTGLGYTIFHLTMFVKWSRYMQPAVPFLIISTVIVLVSLGYKSNRILKNISTWILYLACVFAIAQGLNFFTIYLKPDPRLEAAEWLSTQTKEDDTFAGEVYDMGMTAFNAKFGSHRITEFDYYHIDEQSGNEEKLTKLNKLLDESEYLIVPAERIYPTRARLPETYPNGFKHYYDLFEGDLGFEKVADFTRTTYLEDLLGENFYSGGVFAPLNYDETFRVFDQPTVTIFKKVK